MQLKNLVWRGCPALLAFLMVACASTPDAPTQAQITDQITDEATVLLADRNTRELTLQRSDGTRVTVVAGPEVPLDQINVGDKIVASYVMSLSARRLAEDEPDVKPTLGVAAAQAEPGERPARAVGTDVIMTVVIKTVDYDQHVVTFTDPAGLLHAIEAEREQGKAFVAGLKPGDRVVLEYGELLMLGVK